MKIRLDLYVVIATSIFAAGSARNAYGDAVMSTQPVYVPDTSRELFDLGSNTLAWDATTKTSTVPADAAEAHFVFYFTNVAKQAGSPIPVTILDVQPSCECTKAQLPPLPWTIAPGTNGQIGVTVDLTDKYGTIYKTVHVGTDRGSLDLLVQINILPQVIPKLTEAERIQQMAVAKADRQAVFKNDCVTCHVKPGEDRYGKALFDANCGICHEAEHRATMVPDLHGLKVPTNEDFWYTWIAHGKPRTLMPAFSTTDGGPLSDLQISSLAAYLNATIPSPAPPPQ